MKTRDLYAFIIILGMSISLHMQGQGIKDHTTVKQIYEALQDKNTASQNILALTPGINWNEIKNPTNVKDNYSITFISILNKEWRNLEFDDLKFQTNEENKVVVTGIVKGRQPTECEYLSNYFKHTWSLEDGKIMSFVE